MSCSEFCKPVAVPGAELLELSPSQKSLLQHYRSLHITALKQTSSYLMTSPNARSTITAEIFFNFSHQSCSGCVVARTGKLQCPAHHLPAPAWQKPYRQGAKAPGTKHLVLAVDSSVAGKQYCKSTGSGVGWGCSVTALLAVRAGRQTALRERH